MNGDTDEHNLQSLIDVVYLQLQVSRTVSTGQMTAHTPANSKKLAEIQDLTRITNSFLNVIEFLVGNSSFSVAQSELILPVTYSEI